MKISLIHLFLFGVINIDVAIPARYLTILSLIKYSMNNLLWVTANGCFIILTGCTRCVTKPGIFY